MENAHPGPLPLWRKTVYNKTTAMAISLPRLQRFRFVSKNRIYLSYIKRPFDFLLAAFGVIALSPVFLVVSLLIFFHDGTPILFRQQRVGQNGRLFTLTKFRTMALTGDQNTITVSGDPRITSVGAFLRKYKLDELPQLWNVLKGEMSFVGPRPDVPGYVDQLEGEARTILSLRPGITGPATLAFRNEEELLARAEDPKRYNDEVIFPRKVEINLQYLEDACLVYDLKLILRTVFNK